MSEGLRFREHSHLTSDVFGLFLAYLSIYVLLCRFSNVWNSLMQVALSKYFTVIDRNRNENNLGTFFRICIVKRNILRSAMKWIINRFFWQILGSCSRFVLELSPFFVGSQADSIFRTKRKRSIDSFLKISWN